MKPLAGDAGPEESAAHESLACSDPAAGQKLKPTPGSTRCYACAAACSLAGFAPCVPCRYSLPNSAFPDASFGLATSPSPYLAPAHGKLFSCRRTLRLLPRWIFPKESLQGNNRRPLDRKVEAGAGAVGRSRPSVRDLVGRRHVRRSAPAAARPHPRRLSVPARQRVLPARGGVHTGATPGGRREQGMAHPSYQVPSPRGVDQPIRPRDPPRAPRPQVR